MSSIEVSQVSSKAERDAFIKFPWEIYRRDPAWVPPLLIERKEFLDRRKHPFYEHGDAALFLARSAGKIVGRIMACDDPNYNAYHSSNVGCFGLFESVDDPAVASALFDAATKWLRAKGRDEIMGPIDYSTNYVCGLLVEGFQFPPTLLTAHNPAYYRRLVEGFGFEKKIDFYAWWFDEPENAARPFASALRFPAEKTSSHNSTGRFEKLWRRSRKNPRDLQRCLEGQLGLRALHREGIPIPGEGVETAGGAGIHPHRGSSTASRLDSSFACPTSMLPYARSTVA